MNRLSEETSAYLLAHADNPVNWYPWGDEAFAAAESENKPIFLSTGYSSCHWCHVMEEESFQNPQVAALMNETFICIKVDREERPDIDNLYMKFTVAMTGSGGWPMTVIMTPDGKPFFTGTYLPKDTSFGRTGMMQLIPLIHEQWEAGSDAVTARACEIEEVVLRSVNSPSVPVEVSSETVNNGFHEFRASYDSAYGGFGRAPKFPSPHNLLFLLRYWKVSGEQEALEMVESTLRAIREGGIYDQIGFGIHRYSTDREWLVPHFEKMLYDQALFTMALLETYQATGDVFYATAASEMIEYVFRVMTSPDGAFNASEDADSSGGEGAYYTWSTEELSQVLSADQAALAAEYWNISDSSGILHQSGSNTFSPEQLIQLEGIREILLERRGHRQGPALDRKILTDWNGLMIASLARASAVLENPRYLNAAVESFEFILENMMKEDQRLCHSYAMGRQGPDGFLDDYAFLITGSLELYRSTLNPRYLQLSMNLQAELDLHFADQSGGGYFFTGDYTDKPVTRLIESYDGAVPSGNSVELINLITLWKLTGDLSYMERAEAMEAAFGNSVALSPTAYSMMLSGIMSGQQTGTEVVLAGDPDDQVMQEMLQVLRSEFRPFTTVMLDDRSGNTAVQASVCINGACSLPVETAEELRNSL